MDATSFDRIVRSFGFRGSRRSAIGLALAASGRAASGADAARCSQADPCPECQRCRKRACEPVRDGRACAAGSCRRGECRCRPEGGACATEGFAVCCSGSCDFRVGDGTCSPCRGRGCASRADCCGGLACTNSYCGGCRDRGTVCAAAGDCCFSDCAAGVCLSTVGGRCQRNVDCRKCYLGGNCSGACVGGTCTV